MKITIFLILSAFTLNAQIIDHLPRITKHYGYYRWQENNVTARTQTLDVWWANGERLSHQRWYFNCAYPPTNIWNASINSQMIVDSFLFDDSTHVYVSDYSYIVSFKHPGGWSSVVTNWIRYTNFPQVMAEGPFPMSGSISEVQTTNGVGDRLLRWASGNCTFKIDNSHSTNSYWTWFVCRTSPIGGAERYTRPAIKVAPRTVSMYQPTVQCVKELVKTNSVEWIKFMGQDSDLTLPWNGEQCP